MSPPGGIDERARQAGRPDWEGHYLDGRTAARRRATIRPMRSGLEIATEDGATLWWPYGEIRQTQGFYAGEEVRLERGGELAEVLLVPDAGFLTALRQQGAPELTRRFHDPARRRFRIQLTLLAGLGAIALTAALYLWGIPALAAVLASRVPVAWEERLGKAVADEVAPPGKRCADPARAGAIERILATLTAPVPAAPYTFRVFVVDGATVNAFALPGGYVVVYRGLIERTRTAEELAGVLAHEIQHVLHRHVTRALFQHASTGLLLTALTGDASGVLAYGLEAARTLGTLRYSRQAEEEADADGLRMLQAAGIDPAGMIAFFESLKQEERHVPARLEYLSSHPATERRIERLRALAARPAPPARKLLPDSDWGDIKRICAAAGPSG